MLAGVCFVKLKKKGNKAKISENKYCNIYEREPMWLCVCGKGANVAVYGKGANVVVYGKGAMWLCMERELILLCMEREPTWPCV